MTSMAFRPPLTVVIGQDDDDGNDDHTAKILPILSRIYIASDILRLKEETKFSACVFLHRYAVAIGDKKLSEYKTVREWKLIAAVCLFLACKAEEEARRMRDVINLSEMLFSNSNENQGNVITMNDSPPELNESYWEAKTRIVETERIVLRWLAFDLFVSHPHRVVVLLLENESLREKLIPIAFRRLNDSLFYGPALRCNVLVLACTALELAKEELFKSYSNNDDGGGGVSFSKGWTKRYDIDESRIEKTKSLLNEATKSLCDHAKGLI